MSEYIKREDAIKAIKKDIMGGLNYESILNDLPSADVVERSKYELLEGEINFLKEKYTVPQVIDMHFDSMGFVVVFDNGWKTRYTIGRLEEE